MKLDRKALDRLLSMNDEQLKGVIESLAAESGLDLRSFGITEDNIASIRKALTGATDEDIKKASEQLEEFNKRERKRS
ncbi:MAG: hypothetical protein IJZ89_04500 [Clostridia bacterium]|nr:hypothetical protein [Clostridia bacterium]